MFLINIVPLTILLPPLGFQKKNKNLTTSKQNNKAKKELMQQLFTFFYFASLARIQILSFF